tara:strand:+ start:352 stop:1491 length:1140 start_codon:yes stop_codon:yes gene_type:complete
MNYDYLIVGCGLSGAVLAERIASQLQKRVLIIESRNHIGGNCYDYRDPETGILLNQYGAHLFHTNSERVWNYVTRFDTWKRWEHTVLSKVDNQFVSIPVNITTINKLCGETLQTQTDVEEWLQEHQKSYETIENSEQMAKSRIGSVLYDKLIKHYTYKQWKKYPNELKPSVLARIPVRPNFDTRYFSDKYQALPKDGYTEFFKKLLDHPLITIQLETDFFDYRKEHQNMLATIPIIYTGPIDRYFQDKGYEPLEYRSIEFTTMRYYDMNYYQPNSVVNYPEADVPFTRIVEYKHFLNQSSPHTIIVSEVTNDTGEPYYPVPNTKNLELYKKYQQLAECEPNVWFVGRLANYKYFNMDQAIENALVFFEKTLITIKEDNT